MIKGTEIDFIVNIGHEKIYVQSAYKLPTPEKKEQEVRGLKKIGYCSFGNCSALKTFYVCATLVEIDDKAFEGSANVVFTVADSNKVYTVKDGKLARK